MAIPATVKRKKLIFSFLFLLLISIQHFTATAQNDYYRQLYNYYDEQEIYNSDSFAHTAWKPLLYTDTLPQRQPVSWLKRKLFNEHLVNVHNGSFNLFGDLIFDETLGKSKRFVKNTLLNTRGYEVFGNAGSKVYFETALYENEARFPGYIDTFVRKNKAIPGQNGFKNIGDGKGFDYHGTSGRIIYTPNNHFLFDLGYGKNFIGDGYRSLLLSDWSYNYPYLRAAFTFNKFQYSVMWSQYVNNRIAVDRNAKGFRRKWAQTYLLDWQATKRLSLGVFETVIWPDQDSLRKKDVSWQLASPLIFAHGSTTPSGAKNNMIAGFNAKYKILDRTHLYAQVALDHTGSSAWEQRYAWQAGIRSGNIANIQGLNAQLEYNTARPYTYAGNSTDNNYAHNNQPLAHPLGGNFKEGLFIATYSYKKWWFRLETFIAKYGGDKAAEDNNGHDIFKPLYTHSLTDNASIGKGISTTIYYGDFKAAYVINPASNLRIEAGVTYRDEKNKLVKFQDRAGYIGVRMSFRKLFYDF